MADFIEPLKNLADFDLRSFKFLISKYKFFELLCLKQEPGPMQDNDFTVEVGGVEGMLGDFLLNVLHRC